MGLFSIFKKSNILYFPGCVTYFKYPENFELYEKIFSKLGISFRIVGKKICCALPAFEAGYEFEARKLARRNFELFKEEKITGIITSCPGCHKMFLQDYPDFLPDWNIDIENIWQIILDKLKDKPRLIKHKKEELVSYQDPCYLGRYCGIYDEPREILKLIGYGLREFLDARENSFCCGSCGGLPRTNPKLADEIAKERILQAKGIGAKKIITASLSNYQLLKENSKDTGVEIFELSEILAEALGIIKIDIINEDIDKEIILSIEDKNE